MNLMAARLLSGFKNTRTLGAMLTGICFLTAMLVTNDVALLTFVPVAVAVLRGARPRVLITTVTAMTLAANLGSLSAPVGNPQNLYLFTHYELSAGAFFSVTLPLAAVSLLLTAAPCF
jgi:Na+/H+ antiporter NhaD/arsenite permease-like protein